MKQNLLIIPGFGETDKEPQYKDLIKQQKQNFNIVPFVPKWDYSVPTAWLIEMENLLKKIDCKNTVVVSFSLGAYITLLAAENYNFSKIILCSISPFYKEQMHLMPEPAKLFFGVRRVRDFTKHKIPRSTNAREIIFLFGSDDWRVGISEAKKMSKKLNGIFEIIPDTPHELTPEYLLVIDRYLHKKK